MWLKVLVLVLFVLILLSLSSALAYLFQDLGNERKRTLYALGVRITLAAMLAATLIYGFASGQFVSTAPWDRQLHGVPAEQSSPQP